jgi:hypothetical protein
MAKNLIRKADNQEWQLSDWKIMDWIPPRGAQRSSDNLERARAESQGSGGWQFTTNFTSANGHKPNGVPREPNGGKGPGRKRPRQRRR